MFTRLWPVLFSCLGHCTSIFNPLVLLSTFEPVLLPPCDFTPYYFEGSWIKTKELNKAPSKVITIPFLSAMVSHRQEKSGRKPFLGVLLFQEKDGRKFLPGQFPHFLLTERGTELDCLIWFMWSQLGFVWFQLLGWHKPQIASFGFTPIPNYVSSPI